MSKINFLFIIVILLILGTVFFWWPKYQDFRALELEIKEKKAESQTKEDYFSKLNQLSLKLKEYGDQLAKIDSGLPDDPGQANIINFLEKESSQAGLILKNIKLGETSAWKESLAPKEIPSQEKTKKESEIKVMPLSLALFGSYPAFRNFIFALENSARLIEVENISFEAEKAGETQEKREIFNFNLEIKIFSY